MDKLLTINETAKILNVSKWTLRSWDDDGKLKPIRTEGNHRRYRESDVHSFMGKEYNEDAEITEKIAVYCRVSSNGQKQSGDLERQKGRLLDYCVKKKYNVEYVIEEVGSGMNDNRSKMKQLLKLAEEKKITKVVIEHKDRLTRFNKNIYIQYFNSHGVEVEWAHETLPKNYEAEMVEDILTLVNSFSSKIYGKRSADIRRRKKEEGK